MSPRPSSSSLPGGEEPPGRGRQRLADALRWHPTRGQLVAAVLLGLLGFAAAVQIRATREADLEGLRQTDLVRILDDVSERGARLQAEARELEETRSQVTGGSSGTLAALQEARARTRVLGILAGTLPAAGPGVELTISDPAEQVDAAVLLDALQELRDAGAEAIEIGTIGGPAVRVIASTYVADVQGGSGGRGERGVEVDGTVLTSPYRLRVIGDPRTLAAALDIPGGVLDVLRQRQARGTVTQLSTVEITSLRPAPSPRYARPAQPDRGDQGDDDR